MSKYVLKLRIVSPDDRLNDLYKEAVNKMNTEEYLTNPHKDSGFDVFTPKENLKIGPGGTKLVDMKIQCAAYKIVCDDNTCVKVPTAFFMYPRSSIYKSSVRLANNTGIIDSGYKLLMVESGIKNRMLMVDFCRFACRICLLLVLRL